MIDIHTHILPGVDDGAESLDDAKALLQQAKEQGITDIILTPHAILHSSTYLPKEELEQRFSKFLEATKEFGIRLFLGSEIYCTEKMCKALLNGELKTLHDSKYVLIEFSMRNKEDIDEILYNVRVHGYKPILAHPERYEYITVEDIFEIKENAKIQVNASSILGIHGKKVKKLAFQLMKNDLVDFVSSDCHHPVNRGVNLKEAFTEVRKKFGEKYANKVFIENQFKMIKDFYKVI